MSGSALQRLLEQHQKWLAYELVRFHPEAFDSVTEAQIAEFANRAASWYATDAFGTTLAGPLWAKGRIADADDMVEKAVSWALRYLSQKDPEPVCRLMAEWGDQFRPRVRREVRNKLTTGLKNPRRAARRGAGRE